MTTGRLLLQNIRDFLDFDIQIYMKIKERIMEKAKKTKETEIIFFNKQVGCILLCYNTATLIGKEGRA